MNKSLSLLWNTGCADVITNEEQGNFKYLNQSSKCKRSWIGPGLRKINSNEKSVTYWDPQGKMKMRPKRRWRKITYEKKIKEKKLERRKAAEHE